MAPESDGISVVVKFLAEETERLRHPAGEGIEFVLSNLECEISLWTGSRNEFAAVAQKMPQFSELVSGSIDAVLWHESVMNLLQANLAILRGASEAEAVLVGSLYSLVFHRNRHVEVILDYDNARSSGVLHAETAELTRALLTAYQTSRDELVTVEPRSAHTEIVLAIEAVRSKIQAATEGSDQR